MKMRIFLLLGMLSVASLATAKTLTPSIPEGPRIRILLSKEMPDAMLEAKGGFRVIQNETGKILSSGITKRFPVLATQDGLRWGEAYPDVYALTLIPTHPEASFYVDGIQYKGIISIYSNRDNCVTVVNELPVEEFLKSNLSLKYQQPLSKEAIAALAILGRTEIAARLAHRKESLSSKPWDVAADEVGYYGYGVTLQKSCVEDAVNWTRFMVLESTKGGFPTQLDLTTEKAEELASMGYDAQKILMNTFPHTKFGVTINAKQVSVVHK